MACGSEGGRKGADIEIMGETEYLPRGSPWQGHHPLLLVMVTLLFFTTF